tara:strand:+ start:16277 stop:16525 length:249 start_codon:yes stop_codon:yes gene_type:complete
LNEALDKLKINFSLATPLINVNIVHQSDILTIFKDMITKKRGKGTAINEVRNKRTPDDTRYADNYDNIFRKPAATTKTKKSK